MAKSTLTRLVAAGLLGMAVACTAPTAGASGGPTPVAVGTLTASDLAVAPSDADVSLTGRIGVTNDGASLGLTVADIERLSTVEVDLMEPFTEERARFRGVLVGELLDLADVPPEATELHLVAIDDYSVTLGIEELRAAEAVLATRQDGGPMEIADGGPVRLVFPDDSALAGNTDLWIWSIRGIDVR